MKNTIIKTVLVVFLTVLIFSCKSEKQKEKITTEIKTEEIAKEKEIPNSIPLKEMALYPESIAYKYCS